MNITLTPEIERVLSELAEQQGTTIKLLALKTLRERLLSKETKLLRRTTIQQFEVKTLADRLTGYIGKIDSSEIIKGGAQMSKSIGKNFGDILIKKQQQGRL